MNKITDGAFELFKAMARSFNGPSERNTRKWPVGIYEIYQLSAIQAQLTALTNKLSQQSQKGTTLGQIAAFQNQAPESETTYQVENVQFFNNMDY